MWDFASIILGCAKSSICYFIVFEVIRKASQCSPDWNLFSKLSSASFHNIEIQGETSHKLENGLATFIVMTMTQVPWRKARAGIAGESCPDMRTVGISHAVGYESH